MRVLSILALGVSLASAIQFTNPAENATLTKESTFDLQWDTVDTDPSTFSVYLVNFVNWPPSYTLLDVGFETSTGEASVRVPCDVDNSYGYQFNAINGTNVYVIYAQTPKFSIAGDSCTDPVATTAPTGPTCAAAPTVTVTVRGNSSFTGVVAGDHAAATSATSTFQGTCPETIGWSGDYGRPVTLTSTPHADRGVATATPSAVSSATATTLLTGSAAVTAPTAGATAVQKAAVGGSKCAKKRQPKKGLAQ